MVFTYWIFAGHPGDRVILCYEECSYCVGYGCADRNQLLLHSSYVGYDDFASSSQRGEGNGLGTFSDDTGLWYGIWADCVR
ncbi:hypothetical protein D3C78_1325970 [compost metagenome]